MAVQRTTAGRPYIHLQLFEKYHIIEKTEVVAVVYYLVHLLSCSVQGVAPLPYPNGLDWTALLQLARFHSVSPTAYLAISQLEHPPENLSDWADDYQKNVAKELMFDSARSDITKTFQEHNIKYLPLKGILLQKYYPKLGMRAFCDNDILVEAHQVKVVESLMTGLGYQGYSNPASNQDVYKKPPLINIEIHKSLLRPTDDMHQYWQSVWDKTTVEQGMCHRLSHEDYYLFFLTHYAKHMEHGGCGLRALVDFYVLSSYLKDKLEWSLVEQGLHQLQLTEFYHAINNLTCQMFHNPTKPPQFGGDEIALLQTMMEQGTYGLQVTAATNAFQRSEDNKFIYLVKRIFPTFSYACTHVPQVAKHPVLYPVAFLPLCLRRGKSAWNRRNDIVAETTFILKHKEKETR